MSDTLPPQRFMEELLSRPMQSVTQRGKSLRIRFGTNDVRDLSDGQLPVEIWRCCIMKDGSRSDSHEANARLAHRVDAAARRAGAGARAGARKEWVEIRTPAARMLNVVK